MDIIHPLPGASYNYTTELPIIFSAKNLKNLVTLKEYSQFRMGWGIMPYGLVGQDIIPGGVYTDEYWIEDYNSSTEFPDELIVVHTTNPRDWQWGPLRPGKMYALQWRISLDFTDFECGVLSDHSAFVFNIMVENGTEPNLSKLSACPAPEAQLVISLDGIGPATSVNDDGSYATRIPCPVVDKVTATGSATCAVPLGRDMVSSISSEAHSQAIAATQTTETISEAPEPSESDGAATAGKGLGGSVLLAALVAGLWSLTAL